MAQRISTSVTSFLAARGFRMSTARAATASNAGWLVAERLLSGLLAVTVTAAVARHLGPASFGVLNLALSLVLLFSTFWTLGLSGIVVRDLVASPDSETELLGTLTVLRLAGGAIAFLAAIGLTYVLGLDELTRLSVAILMFGVLGLYALDGIDFWLQAQVKSRHAVAARSAALLVASALNVGLIVTGAPLLAFVVVAALEYLLAGAGLLIAYLRLHGGLRGWRFQVGRARYFVAVSWPLILSGVANAINLRVDQLMLGTMRDSSEVGVYAAAARLSEVWYFVPTAIAASVFPGMVRARAADALNYERHQQRLYDLMVSLALPIAVLMTVAGGTVVGFLYGPEFLDSGPILAIHVWAGPFVFMAAILSRWLIAENRLMFSFLRHGLGAAVNVLLNVVLIPRFGALGAAWATLISYAAASYVATFLFPPVRGQGRKMTLALLVPFRSVRSLLGRVVPERR